MDEDPRLIDARHHVRRLKGLRIHALVFSCVMSGLLGLNIILKSDWWVQWPFLGWGIGLIAHAILVFAPIRPFGPDWEERKIKDYLNRPQR